jgi:hypothetical protein
MSSESGSVPDQPPGVQDTNMGEKTKSHVFFCYDGRAKSELKSASDLSQPASLPPAALLGMDARMNE